MMTSCKRGGDRTYFLKDARPVASLEKGCGAKQRTCMRGLVNAIPELVGGALIVLLAWRTISQTHSREQPGRGSIHRQDT
jgi:hypothetical protein